MAFDDEDYDLVKQILGALRERNEIEREKKQALEDINSTLIDIHNEIVRK